MTRSEPIRATLVAQFRERGCGRILSTVPVGELWIRGHLLGQELKAEGFGELMRGVRK